MIFFVANDGTIIKSGPSFVYQGSEDAGCVCVVAPFAANAECTAIFKLPNGELKSPLLLTAEGVVEGVINNASGKAYALWKRDIPEPIARYYGEVQVQFFFHFADRVLTTSSSTFTVGRGVARVLPDTPDDTVYEDILSNIVSLQSQLDNGAFTARSIYAWNSIYVYGVNELVYYPNKGEYGTILKSLIKENNTTPYAGEDLNSDYWQEIIDFNYLNNLYEIKTDAEQAALIAKGCAATAEAEATKAATYEAGAKSAKEVAEALKNTAVESAEAAKSWAEVAKQYAQFGIKFNTEYASLSELPTPGNSQFIYLIPNGSTGNNSYDEYMWVENKSDYEKVGTTEIDLTDYATLEKLFAEETTRSLADDTLGARIDTIDKVKADKNDTCPNMTVGNSLFATCSDSSGTTEKNVTIPGFIPQAGSRIVVRFTYAGTQPGMSLNVNGTGARFIVADGDSKYVRWPAGSTMEFVFDGSSWVIMGGYRLLGRPVGCVEIRTDNTSPGSLYGGSWERIADGKTLIGTGSGFTLGSEGGATTHSHTLENGYAAISMKQSNAAYWTRKSVSNYQPNFRSSDADVFSEFSSFKVAEATALGGSTDEAEHLPPYLVVNIWKRTA